MLSWAGESPAAPPPPASLQLLLGGSEWSGLQRHTEGGCDRGKEDEAGAHKAHLERRGSRALTGDAQPRAFLCARAAAACGPEAQKEDMEP